MLNPTKNNEQYEQALERVCTLMQQNVKPGSKEPDELEVLSILIKAYEYENSPVPIPPGANEYGRSGIV